jgi:hypothetical protein
MRVLVIAAAVAVVAACTPRDNRDADLELRHSPEEAVYGEPTVTGGAYDSIIYRVGREGGVAAGRHGGAAAADPAPADTAAADSTGAATPGADTTRTAPAAGPAH